MDIDPITGEPWSQGGDMFIPPTFDVEDYVESKKNRIQVNDGVDSIYRSRNKTFAIFRQESTNVVRRDSSSQTYHYKVKGGYVNNALGHINVPDEEFDCADNETAYIYVKINTQTGVGEIVKLSQERSASQRDASAEEIYVPVYKLNNGIMANDYRMAPHIFTYGK